MILLNAAPDTTTPWLVHLESLSLIRLVLSPGGRCCLLSENPGDLCPTAFSDLVATMPLIVGVGVPEPFTVVTYAAAGWDLPSFLFFVTPMEAVPSSGPAVSHSSGLFAMSTAHPRLIVGFFNEKFVGPIWESPPPADSRDSLLRSALDFFDERTKGLLTALSIEHEDKIGLVMAMLSDSVASTR